MLRSVSEKCETNLDIHLKKKTKKLVKRMSRFVSEKCETDPFQKKINETVVKICFTFFFQPLRSKL